MKACFVFGVLLVVFAVVTSAAEIRDKEPLHTLAKRDTIQGPAWPNPCVFYQCIADCKRKGKINGGICTLTGCHCLN